MSVCWCVTLLCSVLLCSDAALCSCVKLVGNTVKLLLSCCVTLVAKLFYVALCCCCVTLVRDPVKLLVRCCGTLVAVCYVTVLSCVKLVAVLRWLLR